MVRRIGEEKDVVYEAGLYTLTLDQTGVLVYTSKDRKEQYGYPASTKHQGEVAVVENRGQRHRSVARVGRIDRSSQGCRCARRSDRPKRRTIALRASVGTRMSLVKYGRASRKERRPEARCLNLPRWSKPMSRPGRVPRTSWTLIAMETVAISDGELQIARWRRAMLGGKP